MNPVYLDKQGELILDVDEYHIFPDQGGITSNYERLKILIELLNADPYDYHTIEVHNPEKCNLDKLSLSRWDMNHDVLDKVRIQSVLLKNKVAVVDIAYAKNILGLGSKLVKEEDLAKVQILDIEFESTRDGKNPGPCELRAFANQIQR